MVLLDLKLSDNLTLKKMTEISASSPSLEVASSRSAVLNMFDSFRETLDEQNDRYERLVKLSRDLTIQSKRIIFLLHRVVANPPTPPAPATSVPEPLPSGVDDGSAQHPGDALVAAILEDTVTPARSAELSAARQARQKFEGLKPIFSKMAAELKGQEPERFDRAMSVLPLIFRFSVS